MKSSSSEMRDGSIDQDDSIDKATLRFTLTKSSLNGDGNVDKYGIIYRNVDVGLVEALQVEDLNALLLGHSRTFISPPKSGILFNDLVRLGSEELQAAKKRESLKAENLHREGDVRQSRSSQKFRRSSSSTVDSDNQSISSGEAWRMVMGTLDDVDGSAGLSASKSKKAGNEEQRRQLHKRLFTRLGGLVDVKMTGSVGQVERLEVLQATKDFLAGKTENATTPDKSFFRRS